MQQYRWCVARALLRTCCDIEATEEERVEPVGISSWHRLGQRETAEAAWAMMQEMRLAASFRLERIYSVHTNDLGKIKRLHRRTEEGDDALTPLARHNPPTPSVSCASRRMQNSCTAKLIKWIQYPVRLRGSRAPGVGEEPPAYRSPDSSQSAHPSFVRLGIFKGTCKKRKACP